MYLMPLIATLMSSVFAGALPITARNLGHRGVAVFSIISLIIAFISSALIWIDLYVGSSPVWLDLYGSWFEVGTVTVSWVFYYDLLTAHMLFTVTSVSLAVHIYAVVYMRNDPHLTLFMSYLSLFTFFMLVYVCGDNLLVMLVGWEGLIDPNSFLKNPLGNLSSTFLESQAPKGRASGFTNSKGTSLEVKDNIYCLWYVAHKSAISRKGPHSDLFKQIMVGLLLGDGWLERRGDGTRLGVSCKHIYKDVAEWYQLMFFGLGYQNKNEIKEPLRRVTQRRTISEYYQIRTFAFSSLNKYYDLWYVDKKKVVPCYIENYLTPLALSLWLMGDGSGMRDGGFKLSTHSFTEQDNIYLAELLNQKYGLKVSVQKDGNKRCLYIWKQSIPKLKALVLPFFHASCMYKWRHVKQ